MRRLQCSSRVVAPLVLVSLLLLAERAEAQRVTGTPMPRGEVTGLELGIEGGTSAPRGAAIRWFFTLYEVVGHDTLRPARAGRLRVLASDRVDQAIAELRTDRNGRAEVAIPVLPDSPSSFTVVVEARSGGVRRLFSTSVDSLNSARIELVADRAEAQPGELVSVVGRAVSLVDGRPLAGRELRVSAVDQDGRSLGPRTELETADGGQFVANVEVPAGVTAIRITAHLVNLGRASVQVAVSSRDAPRMVVRAVPRARLVSPGASVPVDVMVRRADGRPVRGARISLGGDPAARTPSKVRTDRAGRATIRWEISRGLTSAAIEDVSSVVHAARDGLGAASDEIGVRVAREAYRVGIAVEGGGLVPDLPSRIYVRVGGADGLPAAQIPIVLESPLFGTLRERTGAEGVAVFHVRPVVRAGIEGRDRCGGATASSTVITVGEGDDALRLERCTAIDPDSTIRLRPDRHVLAAGEELAIEVFRASSVAREPTEIMLLRRHGERLEPVARELLSVGARQATITVPSDISGEVVLRARSLIGRALEPVRGGTAMIWVTTGTREGVSVRSGEGGATVRLARDGIGSTLLVVPEEEAEALMERLSVAIHPSLGRLLERPSEIDGALLEGWLAARTPRDDACPAVLRGGDVVVMPAPDDPTLHGVQRDPVRVRSRFVRGRLALVVRTIEQRLEEGIPTNIGDVGVHTPRGWRFNREALTAVIGEHLLSGPTPRTLGGEPLMLADLEAFDSAFTFDNMARRVTRKRLLALLIALRDFVRERELDLWHQRGDPALWLRLVVDDRGLDEAALFDAWGRPMTIRRAPGGRARFDFLHPLPQGYELVSAGPDGRFGTGDDLFDPFERVLTAGSAYAEAVAESDLLARLHRVELSQATIAEVARIFVVDPEGSAESSEEVATRGWADLLVPTPEIEGVEHFQRSWLPMEREPAVLSRSRPSWTSPLDLGEEPRSYSIIAVAWTREGWASTARAPHRGGFPVILSAEPLRRLGLREPLILPIVVASLPGGPESPVISVEGQGSVSAELVNGDTRADLVLGPGGAVVSRVRLSGQTEGRGRVRIDVAAPDGGGGRSISLDLRVLRRGSLRSQIASAALSGPVELPLEVPRDARDVRGQLVLSRPTDFFSDPALEQWLRFDPALVAWAASVSGQELPPEVVRQLESVTHRDGTVSGEIPELSAACAAVAWASSTQGVSWAQRATAAHVASNGASESGDLRGLARDAAILAALSIAASPAGDAPLSRAMTGMQDALRATVRGNRNNVGLLARSAAALLLSDRRDVRGRTMLSLVREHLAPGFRGGLVVAIEGAELDAHRGRSGSEQLIATAALAIAAHQAGERELARELAEGLAARTHVALELGGEPLFWLLAARAFGVFGIADSVTVTVERGQDIRQIVLDDGVVTLPLDLPTAGRATKIRVVPSAADRTLPLVRSVARYSRAPQSLDGGPFGLAIGGDTGFVSERSAFVATITNRRDLAVDRPVLLVTLPSGATLDQIGRDAMTRSAGVVDVAEPDGRGVVRVRCAPLAAGEEMRLPIPVRWTAAGRRQGIFMVAFPEDRAWELSALQPEELDVPFRPDSDL